MVDSGWVAVAGAVVGGTLTGAIAIAQARSQRKFDAVKAQEERKWSEQITANERDHIKETKRREELMQIYLQYQLAADRLENAIRDLAGARAQHGPASKAFEAAQAEYDKVCELVKLVAPVTTVQAAMRQRRLFNRLAVEALDGTYDHDVNYPAIAEMADPVLVAMRSDLGSPD